MSKKLTCHCIALTTKIKEEFSNSAPVKRPLLTSLHLGTWIENSALQCRIFSLSPFGEIAQGSHANKNKAAEFFVDFEFPDVLPDLQAIKTSKRPSKMRSGLVSTLIRGQGAVSRAAKANKSMTCQVGTIF